MRKTITGDSTTTTLSRAELFDHLKVHGIRLAGVSRRTGIPYQRLWRYFAFQSELGDEELQLVHSLLSDGENEVTTRSASGE